MAASLKLLHLFSVFVLVITRLNEVNGSGGEWVITGLSDVHEAGECGEVNPGMEAFKLAPCALAAQVEDAFVSRRCCAQVKKLGKNPECMCAVMLSDTAKRSGIEPEIAMTIPKRCNIADRPVGYQCGAYTLP